MIGVGGLGHVAIQILRAVTAATIVAVDIDDDRLALATEVGAQRTVRSGPDAAIRIREMTAGIGAEAVFDFVGTNSTLQVAREIVALDGDVQIVGIGGATLPTGFFSTPFGASVRAPYWGSRSELVEVLDLARSGAVRVHVDRYTLDEAPEAYRRLHDGGIRGRAVVVP